MVVGWMISGAPAALSLAVRDPHRSTKFELGANPAIACQCLSSLRVQGQTTSSPISTLRSRLSSGAMLTSRLLAAHILSLGMSPGTREWQSLSYTVACCKCPSLACDHLPRLYSVVASTGKSLNDGTVTSIPLYKASHWASEHAFGY